MSLKPRKKCQDCNYKKVQTQCLTLNVSTGNCTLLISHIHWLQLFEVKQNGTQKKSFKWQNREYIEPYIVLRPKYIISSGDIK